MHVSTNGGYPILALVDVELLVSAASGDRAACGRAESPVLATFAAESELVANGAYIDERTALRRALPG